MHVITMVCFANSRKLGGRCLAGKRLDNLVDPKWVRPISTSETGEIPASNCRYSDGSQPAPLDIINLGLLHHNPHQHQQENWLINPVVPLQKINRLDYESAQQYLDSRHDLWESSISSSNYMNNRLEADLISNHNDSLRLIKVKNLNLTTVESVTGKNQLRGAFEFSGKEYAFPVTDIFQEGRFLNQLHGKTLSIGECLVTVSLGEQFKGFYYKLIAGVILPGEHG
jgi:hypothetical protein